MTKLERKELIHELRCAVREAGYNYDVLRQSGNMGQDYSRAYCLFDDAVRLLRKYDPQAEEFCKSTYGSGSNVKS